MSSRSVTFAAGHEVFAPRFPAGDAGKAEIKTRTITLPLPDNGRRKGIVLAVNRHGSELQEGVLEVENYFKAVFYDSDGNPLEFPVTPQDQHRTIAMGPQWRHYANFSQLAVRVIFNAYIDGDYPTRSQDEPHRRQKKHSVHSISCVRPDGSFLHATVFFANESFCPMTASERAVGYEPLGMTMANPIKFMCCIDAPASLTDCKAWQPWTVINKNVCNICWFVQALNAFNEYNGQHLLGTMGFINSLTDAQHSEFINAVERLPADRMTVFKDQMEMFSDIYAWFLLCNSLEDVRIVDAELLKHNITTNRLSGFVASRADQEDSKQLFITLIDAFHSFHCNLLKLGRPDLTAFIRREENDPSENFCMIADVNYLCPFEQCGSRVVDHTNRFGYGIQICPNDQDLQTLDDFESACNSLSSLYTIDSVCCRNCKKHIPVGVIERVEPEGTFIGSKFLIHVNFQKCVNNEEGIRARDPWNIPLGEFIYGRNICKIVYALSSHTTSDESGHYTGLKFVHNANGKDSDVYFLDDGVPPLYLGSTQACTRSVSRSIYLLVCVVIGHSTDNDHRQFRAKIDKQHVKEFGDVVVKRLMDNMNVFNADRGSLKVTMEDAMSARAGSPADDGLTAAAVLAVNKAFDRVVELTGLIARYDSSTPTDSRHPMIAVIERNLDEVRQTVLNHRVTLGIGA